jgi:transcriptional antiterminator RfaH
MPEKLPDKVLNQPPLVNPLQREWNVIYTAPRSEKIAYDRLIEEKIVAYLPLFTTVRKWKDRKKKVELPLFNSYVFVYVNSKERYQASQIPGVVRFIHFQGQPAVVRQKEINAIKRFLNKTEGMSIKVEKGDLVEIAAGPFEGVYGKVLRVGKDKIVLQIEQLKLSLVAEVRRGHIKKPTKKPEKISL